MDNKCDKENEREVQFSEGENLAKEVGMMFYETSALTGQGTETLFTDTTNIIAERIYNNEYDLLSESCEIKTGLNPSEQATTETAGSGIISKRIINSEKKRDVASC